ncbi:substrate-binding domain-containing protein [Omnitrophica bacterium]|nr:substrate-binding domain-containing protein [Candidatus Omnitrophota bacterium]
MKKKSLKKRKKTARRNIKGAAKRPGNINAIGLVIPQFDDMFHTYYITEIMRGICNAASLARLDLLVHLTEKDLDHQKIGSHPADVLFCSGIIFADIQGNEKLLECAINEGIPCVVMNHYDKSINAGCIAIDNKGGAVNAVDYIISLGHQRIAVITGDLSVQAGRDRLKGYKESLRKHGMPIDEALIKEGNFSPQCARKGVSELLDSDTCPSAIFVASDEMAIEVIKTLQQRKVKVPQDVSVVGFDDSWFATQGSIGLTTVSQPLGAMAQRAVNDLRNLILSKTKINPPRAILPTELVIRESCVSPLKQEDFY